MQLTKKAASSGDRKLFTGFFSGKVIGVNPSKEQLGELLGFEPSAEMEEIKYDGETDKGDSFVTLSFWLEASTPEKQKFNARFRIVDKPLISEKSGKKAFVNQSGMQTWCDDESNLPEWFTKFSDKNKKPIADKIVRESMQGEAGLYTFLKAWLGKVSFYDQATNILVDKKKLFRSVDKFIADQFLPLMKATEDEVLIDNVVALATVYTTEKDGEVKQYQNIYQEYLGQTMMKKISLSMSTNSWQADKVTKKFYDQLTGEHGCKDSYTLTMLQDFDPASCLAATNDLMKVDAASADSTDY